MLRKPYFTTHNRLALVRNGQEFIDTCCQMVTGAQQKILFHTYAFEDDEVTHPFVEALIEKAKQGIEVFIIIDAIGSIEISSDLKARFDESHVRFSYFAPLFSKHLENVGRRLHQKVLVIDNDKALVGGINHCQHFVKPAKGEPWLDYALLLEGEEVYRLQRKVQRLYSKYFPKDWPRLRQLIKPNNKPPEECLLVRANANDFMRFHSEIYQSYIRAIRMSKRRIQIFATYFLPGKRLLKELKRARLRGVSIELIFGATSDHPTERWSSKYLYNWYLKNDFLIYEWDESIVHGKLALIDDEWLTLGSYNHNHLSRYINLELNLEVSDRNFARMISAEIEDVKSHCRVISQQSWRHDTTLLHSALYFSTYMLANVITLISTIFIIRKKEQNFND